MRWRVGRYSEGPADRSVRATGVAQSSPLDVRRVQPDRCELVSRVRHPRTYTSRPVQPSATVSRCSSPSSAHTIRPVIGTGSWKVCASIRAPVSLRMAWPGDQAVARHGSSTRQVSDTPPTLWDVLGPRSGGPLVGQRGACLLPRRRHGWTSAASTPGPTRGRSSATISRRWSRSMRTTSHRDIDPRRASGDRARRVSPGARDRRGAGPGRGRCGELEPIFAVRGERLVRIDGYPPHAERFERVGIDIAGVLGESPGAGTREGAA